jgi:hypothetical protein
MNREIEDMAFAICENTAISVLEVAEDISKLIISKGYRKTTDVAREIFTDIVNKMTFIRDTDGDIRAVVTIKDITTLKKKYESED